MYGLTELCFVFCSSFYGFCLYVRLRPSNFSLIHASNKKNYAATNEYRRFALVILVLSQNAPHR